MGRRYYSKRHFQRLSNGGPDRPEDAVERLRYMAAGEQANREMEEKFGPPTPENLRESIAWQAARIKELMGTKQHPPLPHGAVRG